MQPPAYEDKQSPNLVCKLNKALYGLKQTPRAWFDKLRTALYTLGFHSSLLFIKHAAAHSTFVIGYVDDILVTSSSAVEIQLLVQQLNAQFALKDLGNHKTTDGLLLTQTKYIIDLLCKAKMQFTNSLPTPMIGGEKLSI